MSSGVGYTTERIGPVHSLYIGSGPSGTLPEEYRRQILELCGASFLSFTATDARGYFRGKSEDTLVIQVATDDVERVVNLARDIALSRDQLGVGLAGPDANGVLVYRRIIPGRTNGVEA
jgi:hypothetical protein